MSLRTLSQNRTFVLSSTVVLLLLSFILILLDIEAVLNIVFTIMALASSAKEEAGAIGTTVTFVMGIAALAYAVFALEYHVKHAGEPRSRKVLAVSLGVQVVLAVIGLLIL